MSAATRPGGPVRFRLTIEDEGLVDAARGSIPRNLWLREAGLQHARLIQQGKARPLEVDEGDVSPPRATAGSGGSRLLFVRFRLTLEEIAFLDKLRGEIPLGPWLRAAALRHTRSILEARDRGEAV